jgi:hypothetical protein
VNPPPFLYKYRKFDERTISIIVNHAIYFAHADQFNDPFDCRIRFTYEGTDEAWESFLRKTPKGFPDLTPLQIKKIIERKKHDFSLRGERTLEIIEDTVRKWRLSEVGICSLSADPAQILMWSHYSDSHRGCCLEFSTKQNYFETALQVDYPETYPNFNYFNKTQNEMEFLKALLLTKSKLWAYEQEWRMLEFEGSQKIYPFEPRDLTGIIFGYWMNPDHNKLIQRLVQKFDPPVRLYQAVPLQREFKMEIIPIL